VIAVCVSRHEPLCPRSENTAWKQNWKQKGLNNFRQNVQGKLAPNAAPDMTAKKQADYKCDKSLTLTLKVKVCNRGTLPVSPGIPVTFYKGKPAGKQVICTVKTKAQINAGACEEVTCTWAGAPTKTKVDVYVVADDDGAGKGTTNECKEGNNTTVIKGVSCQQIG